MTIEIKSYEGDGTDLADLIVSGWRHTYNEGNFWFPIWDNDYVAWRLMDPKRLDRDLMVVAYENNSLVGCMIGETMDFNYEGEVISGSAISYLSIKPNCKIPGLGLRMAELMRKRHQERNLKFALGITNGSEDAASKKFWNALQKRRPNEFTYHGRLSSWVHILDGSMVAKASPDRATAIASRIGGVFPISWVGSRGNSTPALPEHLDKNLAMVSKGTEPADLTLIWDRDRLERWLHHPYVFSFSHPTEDVLVAGYVIKWCAKQDIEVGVIDLIAGGANVSATVDVLIATLRYLKKRNVGMAMVMDFGAVPDEALKRASFFKGDAKADYFTIFEDPSLDLPAGVSVVAPST